MAPLIGESLAFALAPWILIWLLRRFGLAPGSLGYASAAGVAVVLILGTLSVGNLPASWHLLDIQRSQFRKTTPTAARGACAITKGIDLGAVGWLGAHIPVRERFYFQSSRPLIGGGTCIRFLLLPRLEVGDPARARYLVFWEGVPRAQLAALRRRGATVFTREGRYAIARLP